MTLAHRFDGPADAPVLVLLNSIGTTTALWEPCLAPLTEQFRVLRIDARGHGDSPAPPPTTGVRIADLAADVVAVLDESGLERVDIAGISIGGMTAMWLAINRPERVGRLALVCTSADPDGSRFTERAATVRRDGMSAIADTASRTWITEALRERDPALATELRDMLAGVDPEGYAQCCEAIAAHDVVADLPRIAGPTLVVAGAQDEALPPDPHSRTLADGIAGARYAELDPGAHLLPYEQAGPLAALLREHFRGGATLAAGFATRRAVLGDEHVDRAVAATTSLTEPFQHLITRYAWGDVWTRPELTRRERSLLTLAALTTLGAEHELAMHVRAARRNGLTDEQIVGAVLHTAIYAGVPRANRAVAIARDVLSE